VILHRRRVGSRADVVVACIVVMRVLPSGRGLMQDGSGKKSNEIKKEMRK